MSTFYIKDKEVSCNYLWRDVITFVFDIGDGDLVDSDGDNYFIHVEYHVDTDKYVYEIWWDDEYLNLDECKEEFLTKQEKALIEEVMWHLMKGK